MSGKPIEVEAEIVGDPTSELAVSYTPAVIDDNLAAVEAWVESQVAPYRGAVIEYGDDGRRADARKAMSDLNKMKKTIEADRRRIKDAYTAPLREFERRVGDIIGIIDGARGEIDRQFKAGEKAFKDARRSALQEEYEAVAGPVAALIPLDAIIDSKWMAPKSSEEWACGKLADKAAEALDAYNQMMSVDLEFKDEAVRRFCETLSFAEAIKRNNELVEERRRMDEFRAAQEAVGGTERAADPEPAPPSPPEPPRPAAAATEPEGPSFRWRVTASFEGTAGFARSVADALVAAGVPRGSIEFGMCADE